MSAQITMRQGSEADRAFVLDLGSRTSIDSVSSMRAASEALVRGSFEQLVTYAFARSYVLEIAETALEGPVGFVLMLNDLPDEVTGMPQAFIAYMAVEPESRRHGVARQLLLAAEEQARLRGLPVIALMVTEDNVAARELYAQAGYHTERRLLCKTL
jgi:ribosomal protein S18 acetylase RimI-like enzyme